MGDGGDKKILQKHRYEGNEWVRAVIIGAKEEKKIAFRT